MPRTIVAPERAVVKISPGIALRCIQPGGRRGPHDEVLAETLGGQVWSEMFMLGGKDDGLPMCVPDIRLPANQYWPLHWHDCWIAVIILDGSCLIGDWHMHVGDVLISQDALEYGPLVIGPSGCQMFEIFARLHPDGGGYALEFADHPTLLGSARNFTRRSELNHRNTGRQMLKVDGVQGLTKGHLIPGAQWDLGLADDPERGVLRSTWLRANECVPAHCYHGWHGIFVLDGELTLDGCAVVRNDVLIVEPHRRVGELVVGSTGAQLLEVARTANAIDRQNIA